MPTPTTKLLTILFVVGFFSPIAALILAPSNYSLYMFIPATPPDLLSKIRLWLANAVIITGCALAIISAFWIAFYGLRSKKPAYILFPIIVFLHPLLQPVFLEHLDTYLNYRWYSEVNQLHLMGRSKVEVRSLLGRPTIVSNGSSPSGNYELWEYKPLPLYWFGSKGQVVFIKNRVNYIEPNDD